MGCYDPDAGLDVREVPVAEHLDYELVQSLRPSASGAVLHDDRDVLPVEFVDVLHLVPQRQQSRDDRASAGAKDQVEVLTERLTLEHGFQLGKDAQSVKALCTASIQGKDSAKPFRWGELRSGANGVSTSNCLSRS